MAAETIQEIQQNIDFRDLSNRLSQPWSPVNFARFLKPDVLQGFNDRFASLDPILRIRILLTTLLLPQEKIQELAPQLNQLAQKGEQDNDEWVRYFAYAIQPFDGHLHIDKVITNSQTVRENLQRIEKQLQQEGSQDNFRPLEETYLDDIILKSRGFQYPDVQPHSYFNLRSKQKQHLDQRDGSFFALNQQSILDIPEDNENLSSQKRVLQTFHSNRGPSTTPQKIEVIAQRDVSHRQVHPQNPRVQQHIDSQQKTNTVIASPKITSQDQPSTQQQINKQRQVQQAPVQQTQELQKNESAQLQSGNQQQYKSKQDEDEEEEGEILE